MPVPSKIGGGTPEGRDIQMTPLKKQLQITLITILACILTIGICCSISHSQQITVSPPVDPGIAHHEGIGFDGSSAKGTLAWKSANGTSSNFGHIDGQVIGIDPNPPAVVMIEGGDDKHVLVPKGSYIIVITMTPAQRLQQAPESVIPRSGEGEPTHPNLGNHSGRAVAPIWQTGKCWVSNGSQIDCPTGGAPPVRPTFVSSIDKQFGVVTMTATCPSHYLVDFAIPKSASIADEQSDLELFLNATCSEYSTVPKDDPRWNLPNRFTFTIDFHHLMDMWAREYNKQNKEK